MVYPFVHLHGALGSILVLFVISTKHLTYYQIKINQRKTRMCLLRYVFTTIYSFRVIILFLLTLCSSSAY